MSSSPEGSAAFSVQSGYMASSLQFDVILLDALSDNGSLSYLQALQATLIIKTGGLNGHSHPKVISCFCFKANDISLYALHNIQLYY